MQGELCAQAVGQLVKSVWHIRTHLNHCNLVVGQLARVVAGRGDSSGTTPNNEHLVAVPVAVTRGVM